MRFTPVNKRDIPFRGYQKCKNQKILEEFVASGHECVRLDDIDTKKAGNASSSLNKSCVRFGIHGVRAISRCGTVYLLRVNEN